MKEVWLVRRSWVTNGGWREEWPWGIYASLEDARAAYALYVPDTTRGEKILAVPHRIGATQEDWTRHVVIKE